VTTPAAVSNGVDVDVVPLARVRRVRNDDALTAAGPWLRCPRIHAVDIDDITFESDVNEAPARGDPSIIASHTFIMHEQEPGR
jgi:hypothetical protein